MVMSNATTVALLSILAIAIASVETCLAFGNAHARSSIFAPRHFLDHSTPTLHNDDRHMPPFPRQAKIHGTNDSLIRLRLYRKFHDYGWKKLLSDSDAELDTVREELKSNTSPVKGAPPGTNVVANIRSISRFPCLAAGKDAQGDGQVLRLARSAFLETQSPTNDALTTPMTVHVLNFVLFPSPHIRDGKHNDCREGGYLSLPIFGADIVSLPGNKHLVALDFQPVLPLNESASSSSDGKEKASLFPKQYAALESKLEKIHSKYQKSNSGSTPLLPWGGDIPQQAQRFFSPYALWTRLADENAMDTVDTTVWEAFQEYTDLYLELMSAVQNDVDAGKLDMAMGQEQETDGNNNLVWRGQIDYLEYRRTNDPARPMLQRMYGNEWAENVIGEVLFPCL
eukprot:CAMPEP_0181110390 /NCGR_PEP_ID=MMETSP1071-20121207/18694_1 /TAXON_ID=35127 /ORGANISM="Thalassiosira sp., Strain NH16" /LENGTH=396 /DNA_ID=CAMNT_0023194169 /DNA_START=81 /DNA_END=1271 /DNA_ORIENTATION=+